jgi:hypothetical protein
MTHPRQSIRTKIVTLLTGKTNAGSSVYASQVRPVGEDKLPRIHVYGQKESVEIAQESPREYGRVLTVAIEIQAKADEYLDNILDTLAEQVEQILCQDYTLGDLCDDVILKSSELNISAEGDTLIGACIMTYEVSYETYAVSDATEENGVSDLETVDIKYDQPNYPSGSVDAEDKIDFT